MRAAKEEIACFQRDSHFGELQGESLSVRKPWGDRCVLLADGFGVCAHSLLNCSLSREGGSLRIPSVRECLELYLDCAPATVVEAPQEQ